MFVGLILVVLIPALIRKEFLTLLVQYFAMLYFISCFISSKNGNETLLVYSTSVGQAFLPKKTFFLKIFQAFRYGHFLRSDSFSLLCILFMQFKQNNVKMSNTNNFLSNFLSDFFLLHTIYIWFVATLRRMNSTFHSLVKNLF